MNSNMAKGPQETPIDWPLHTTMGNFEGMKCEEVDHALGDMLVYCGRPVECLVWHRKDRRAYMMCHMCGSHNVMNRGGRLLVDATPGWEILREVARTQKHLRWDK